jgi:pimeloyl-ACP methyl ester carboxylesterase
MLPTALLNRLPGPRNLLNRQCLPSEFQQTPGHPPKDRLHVRRQLNDGGDVPYVNNTGILIHYEVEGSGPPLVLQHGFMQCIQDWYECGYVAALRTAYRMILIDARGHGSSGKPHDATSYTLARRVTDVTAVLNALGLKKGHFWGYSMGGYIGFGMAKYAPDRVDGLVIGGQHPFARDLASFRRFAKEWRLEGGEAFVAGFKRIFGPISNDYAARLRTADVEAYFAAAEDRATMADILETMTMPCCVYAGDADPLFAQARSASERMPNACFFPVPGLSHAQTFSESSTVLPRIVKFLDTAL